MPCNQHAAGMPPSWWVGFARNYQDGRKGEEGRSYHVLNKFEFAQPPPYNWYSNQPLSDWKGIRLIKTSNDGA